MAEHIVSAGIVRVECYSGSRPLEAPSRFFMAGRCFRVDKVVRRWREIQHGGSGEVLERFEVVSGGALWLLTRHVQSGTWTASKVDRNRG